MGKIFSDKLNSIGKKYPEYIEEIRGVGLLIGIELKPEIAKDVFAKLFEKGFLTSLCGGTTLRLAPPFIITEDDINAFCKALDGILGGIKQ